MLDGQFLFSTAAALAIFAGVAAFQAIDAFRWKNPKGGMVAIGAFAAFALVAGFMFSFASRHATFNFWGNALLGPDWECSYAPSSARICNRDLPPHLQNPPPQRAD